MTTLPITSASHGQTEESIAQSGPQFSSDDELINLLGIFTNDDWEGVGEISDLHLPVAPSAPAPKPPCCPQHNLVQPSPVLTSESPVTGSTLPSDVTSEITPKEVHAPASSEEPELIFSPTGNTSPSSLQSARKAEPIPSRPPVDQVPPLQRAHSEPFTQSMHQVPHKRVYSMPDIPTINSCQPMHPSQLPPSMHPMNSAQPVYPAQFAFQGPPWGQREPMHQDQFIYNNQLMQQAHFMQQMQLLQQMQSIYNPQLMYNYQPMYNNQYANQAPPVSPPRPRQPTPKSPIKRTIEFMEPTVPYGFVANPNNHGRWSYDSAGNKHYLNAPKVKRQRTSK
ncbi:hypothetical protein N7492_001249 [Penicillium capsulatum]|uniref:Uncharacterized protein n=1 Tax=Penicillium capsulatum TaxID=69766 RepID=A0A9W9ISV4_9EURO|nr:hypothetical protein N7492_001249 [Penicillium capsulatum]KAJ6129693.1 hypothetical protein N7512_002473 [Penicillium capsulatum]